jgi:hypothetical protein
LPTEVSPHLLGIDVAPRVIIGDAGLLAGGGLVLLSCPPTMLIVNLALADAQ